MSEIRALFAKAALQHEAALGLQPDDWARYRDIRSESEQLRRIETQRYEREYDTRVEAARKALIDRAGGRTRGLVPRLLGVDRFDRSVIERRAHRLVQGDFQRTLDRLEAAEDQLINDLLASAQNRAPSVKRLTEGFAEAADRRSGLDRRKGPSR